MNRFLHLRVIDLLCGLLVTLVGTSKASAGDTENERQITKSRPNFVFCMADDWSWPHAGILGDPAVSTPNFDRVAKEGVLLTNAFVSTPSCTPSRLSILTGQHHWRLKEGDSLGGSLREEFDTYTEMLQRAGYRIGRFGKGVWPSKHTFRKRDSFGERYPSLDSFLKEKTPGQPFCYWHGGQDPHRPYEFGSGERGQIKLSNVRVPACLPDTDVIRGDVADYLWEVERFDQQVGSIIETLRSIGELENTILVVSGDNGMPFPGCKATLYDLGTRVPLAIRWGSQVEGNCQVDDFVSLCDLAPTFLEAAGLKPSPQMTGSSLLPILTAGRSGQIDPERDVVFTGMEKHVYLNPSRSLRKADFLYIRNFQPSEWPTGERENHNPTYDFSVQPWPTEPGAFSFNIDPSPSKQFLRLNRNAPGVKPSADRLFTRRATEELYDLRKDPHQLDNVAQDADYRDTIARLRRQLTAELIKTADPRAAVPGYRSRSIQNWPVRVSGALLDQQPESTQRAIELLSQQLQTVREVLPAGPLRMLQTIPIWLSPAYEGRRPRGEYHPSAQWLKQNGRRAELHQCIEFSNTEIFPREVKRMPMMVLHELAHAYQNQVLGDDNAEIKIAFERAVSSGTYEAVRRGNGKIEKAYAINNPMEYFAETTEAFFGTNDYYPFNRAELDQHDPQMLKLLKRVWSDAGAR